MLNILQELEAAHLYVKHGWPTADDKSPRRQSYIQRQSAYEAALAKMLDAFTEPMTVEQITEKMGIKEGTAKKHVAVLFKRRLLDRSNAKNPSFVYFRVSKR